jgi:glutathione peroxidase
MSGFYDFTVNTSKGEPKRLSDYRGQVLLVVNVASQCGLTPQYAGLQKLYEEYKDRGFVILGFPCNDFGGQEPGTMQEIEQFCSVNYGVTFPLFEKVRILGDGKHPLYQWLTTNAEPQGDVQWNFEKFLIGKNGSIAARFSPKVTPEDAELRQQIEKALK